MGQSISRTSNTIRAIWAPRSTPETGHQVKHRLKTCALVPSNCLTSRPFTHSASPSQAPTMCRTLYYVVGTPRVRPGPHPGLSLGLEGDINQMCPELSRISWHGNERGRNESLRVSRGQGRTARPLPCIYLEVSV